MNRGICMSSKNKFNWWLVVIALIVIVLVYIGVSKIIEKNKLPPRETVYCYFNTSLFDAIPRDQCGLLKIVSRDIAQIGIEEFQKFGQCSKLLDELPGCEGEVYHFGRYPLKEFCDDPGCNTDGVICAAYHIKYHNESQYKEMFEASFTEPNLASREELMERMNKCNA